MLLLLAVMYSSDTWETDFDETVYKSAPMVRKEEFVLGVYGSCGLSTQTEYLCKPLLFNNFPSCLVSEFLSWPMVDPVDGPPEFV